MTLHPPSFVQSSGIVGAPIGYTWNADLALDLYGQKDQNPRLYLAIDQASYKAKMSLAVAIAEVIVWRFSGHVDLTDATNRVEAGWASAVDAAYARDLDAEMTHDDDQFPIEGALELALCVLGEANSAYRTGSIYLAEPVVKLATLAAHILPDKDVFQGWLSSAVRALAQAFPRTTDYDRASGVYDASHEKPVPREFFDPPFRYDDNAAAAAIRQFLQSLDPQRNPHLRSADEMRAAGFTGTPYRY